MPKLRPSLVRYAASALLAVPLTLSVAGFARAEVTTYEIDKSHSSILFRVRHLLSKVPGQFNQFSGTIDVDPEKRDTVNATASIDVTSIDTDEAKRDQHLRGPDFFDTEKFPKITFKGSKLKDVNPEKTRGKLEGELTIRDVTRPIVLDVEWFGTATDPWGNKKIAFAATTKLNRKDFGIIWNKTLDSGGYLVGDDVDIEINVEAGLPKAAAK
jgi:polyisoprenoid-binding protein YceI